MSDLGRWKIVTLDVTGPLPALAREETSDGTLVQLWAGTTPLGQLWLPSGLLPLPPAALAGEIARTIAPALGDRIMPCGFRAKLPVFGPNPARDEPADFPTLAGLTKPLSLLQAAPSPVPEESVSVIICTRRRPEALARCLESLQRLAPAPDQILVVDNAADDPSTREVAGRFPGVTYLAEPRPGLSRARNAALPHAKGRILAWTDDDTVVHPGWIGALREAFGNPTIDGVTGLVLAGELESAAQARFEQELGGFQRGFRAFTFDPQFFEDMKAHGVPTWLAGAGANMAMRREVFDRIGHFDERLGAGASGCSEDSEFWYRMLAAGLSLRYEPRAVVWHTHRIDDAGLDHQLEEYMRGHAAALLVQARRHGHTGNLRRLFLSIPRHYWRVAKMEFIQRKKPTWPIEIRGLARGVLHYLRHRE